MQEFMSAAFGHVVRAIVVSAAATLGLTAVGQAAAAEKVSMRLKWIAQAQFVGFYEAEGLDMTINPGGPNLNGETLVASNSDNFAVAGGLENLLGGRAKGLPI